MNSSQFTLTHKAIVETTTALKKEQRYSSKLASETERKWQFSAPVTRATGERKSTWTRVYTAASHCLWERAAILSVSLNTLESTRLSSYAYSAYLGRRVAASRDNSRVGRWNWTAHGLRQL